MKSNYDCSKTIICKTTKSYHPHADDPLLLIICRHISIEAFKRGWKAIDYLGIINCTLKICLTCWLVKLAGDGFLPSCLCNRDCVTKYHPRGVLFWLFVYSIFSEIKTQNFVDDALLVQEIHSFIFLISDFCQNPSQTNSPCPHPTPQLQLPWHCNFSPGFWWSVWGGNNKNNNNNNVYFLYCAV